MANIYFVADIIAFPCDEDVEPTWLKGMVRDAQSNQVLAHVEIPMTTEEEVRLSELIGSIYHRVWQEEQP